jgi:uncharacterized damage-inducible protein DinB
MCPDFRLLEFCRPPRDGRDMITPAACLTFARYNRWQNRSIYDAAATLSDEDRRRDRGAFFGSIQATLSHLMWGDTVWMSRFDGWEKPVGAIQDSVEFVGDWEELRVRRAAADARILDWAGRVDPAWLGSDATWYSGALGREVTKNAGLCVAHFFNHQTHHRGQVHAMLTAAGARPGDTDLFAMPDEA